MKVVFKGVLTINFTENKTKLDFTSIKNYLLENNLLVNIGFRKAKLKNFNFFFLKKRF
jgi:hypothetical protein